LLIPSQLEILLSVIMLSTSFFEVLCRMIIKKESLFSEA